MCIQYWCATSLAAGIKEGGRERDPIMEPTTRTIPQSEQLAESDRALGHDRAFHCFVDGDVDCLPTKLLGLPHHCDSHGWVSRQAVYDPA